MKAKSILKLLLGGSLIILVSSIQAQPWFTGPLLAPDSEVLDPGDNNYQPYLCWTSNRLPNQNYQSIIPEMFFTLAMWSFMDMQIALPYIFNFNSQQSGIGVGDLSIALQFQLVPTNDKRWYPSVLFYVSEFFPSGRFANLSPIRMGLDSTGQGSFQTSFGIVLMKTVPIFNQQYLCTTFAVIYTLPSMAEVQGFNAYGGGLGTLGRVYPGNTFALDLAFEWSITRHWVPVMEFYYQTSEAATFTGTPGTALAGGLAINGIPTQRQLSLAPAIEYNFNENLGVIAGVWFSVASVNATQFTSGVVSVNYYE